MLDQVQDQCIRSSKNEVFLMVKECNNLYDKFVLKNDRQYLFNCS